MNYPRYPEYKPSGVEWLGEMPVHWELKRLKYIASHNDDVLPETTDPDYVMQYVDISSVSLANGIEKKDEYTFEKAPSRARRKVKDGDTIISTVRTYLKAIAPIEAPEDNLVVSTGFAVIRPQADIAPRYLAYQLQSQGFVDAVVANSVGVSYPAINASQLVTLSALIPSEDEQHAIATFLDRETARIDALIVKKQRLVELLAEKRTALISQAVTKGLNPGAPMKHSGVEWLGEVPAHWEVKPLKRGVEFIEGPGILAVDFMLEGIPLLRIAGIGGHKASLEGCNYLAPDVVKQKWEHFRVRCGDLLISGSASTGFCSEVDETTEGAVPYTGIIIIRPRQKETTKNFIRWFFVSGQFLTQAFLAKTGSTIQHFGPSHLSRMTVAVPPLAEQNAIADHLDSETSKLDALGARVEAAIEKLKEYRAALIADAVTGKIDVRNAAKQREVA
jgi:type I restriction enzyme S subunit